jgi:hypothetical protein
VQERGQLMQKRSMMMEIMMKSCLSFAECNNQIAGSKSFKQANHINKVHSHLLVDLPAQRLSCSPVMDLRSVIAVEPSASTFRESLQTTSLLRSYTEKCRGISAIYLDCFLDDPKCYAANIAPPILKGGHECWEARADRIVMAMHAAIFDAAGKRNGSRVATQVPLPRRQRLRSFGVATHIRMPLRAGK